MKVLSIFNTTINIPDWAKYIVQHENGSWWLHRHKPHLNENRLNDIWYPENNELHLWISIIHGRDKLPFFPLWRQTLISINKKNIVDIPEWEKL